MPIRSEAGRAEREAADVEAETRDGSVVECAFSPSAASSGKMSFSGIRWIEVNLLCLLFMSVGKGVCVCVC